jgi:hypothetical protein
MYSFCTVIEPEEGSAAVFTLTDSAIYDVQVSFVLVKGHLHEQGARA